MDTQLKPNASNRLAEEPQIIYQKFTQFAEGVTAMFGLSRNNHSNDQKLTGNALTELDLDASQIYRIKPGRAGRRIEVVSGTAWVTQSGDQEDYILKAGERLTVPRGGVVIVQGMRSAHLRVRTR